MRVPIHQYQVVGRKLPSVDEPNPNIFRMNVFAQNKIIAKSRFWGYMKKLKKVKKSGGEVLTVREVFESKPTKVKNFGIWLRYRSRSSQHNMYKEYRDITTNGAIHQMYQEMAARHRASVDTIQVLRVIELSTEDCRRVHLQQMHDSKIKFPYNVGRPLKDKKHRSVFLASRPTIR